MLRFKKILKYNQITFMLAAFVAGGVTLSHTTNSSFLKIAEVDSSEKKFAGNQACQSCHQSYYHSFENTAHNLTSTPGSSKSIKGSLQEGKNFFSYNKWTEVKLEKKGDSFFQTGYAAGQVLQSEPMDITVGSGRKGQTYLYWKENKLFQLPVSYFTPMNSWCNSPGFPTSMFKFYRQIPGQCMECHATDAKLVKEDEKETIYDRQSVILGITCERCHGPAVDHVNFHEQNPKEKQGKYIINAGNLSRVQQLDACAFCHSGFRKQLKPSFSFTVGDKLDDFSAAAYAPDSGSSLDVHGNQSGLLASSKCFTMSQMNCSSCHNVHETQYNAPKLFSKKCMTCHTSSSGKECKFSPPKKIKLSDNCIDCHMPMQPSNNILLQLPEKQTLYPDYVRTHRIAIYLKSTKDFLEKKKR